LQRATKGGLLLQESFRGYGRAKLAASVIADVHHAMELCREYGVVLALDVPGNRAALLAHPVLWVSAGAGMARCEPMNDGAGRWFVQPGCAVGQLQQQGFGQFHGLAPDTTIANWLLGRHGVSWPTGCTAQSGVVYASVLLADGVRAGLGPFGERNAKPLEGVRLQRLVSSLFQLASSPQGQACRGWSQWPARYRLDALTPANGSAVNLAHLVLESAGELAWVDWLVLEPRDPMTSHHAIGQSGQCREPDDQADALDVQIKRLFDAENILAGRLSV
jgi:hypothetical protein